MALLLATVLLLVGCGQVETPKPAQTESHVPKALKTVCPDGGSIEYTVPNPKCFICTSVVGYDTQDTKRVYFATSGLSGKFTVYNAETKEVAYYGNMGAEHIDSGSGQTLVCGDFSVLHTPGTYYIETDYLGRSNPFTIEEHLSERLLADCMKRYLAEFEQMKASEYTGGAFQTYGEQMVAFLQAYTLHDSAFGDDTVERFAGNNAPDILDICMVVTDWLLEQNTGLANVDCMLGAGVLAAFARIFNKYDSAYATRCRKQAESFYKEASKSEAAIRASITLFAAVELYHLTGADGYEKKALALMESGVNPETDYLALAGCLAYTMGKKSTVFDVCTGILNTLLRMTQDATNHHGKDYFGVADRDSIGALREISVIVVANYLLESTEYEDMIREYTSYLRGLNPGMEVPNPTGEDACRMILLLSCGAEKE